MENKISASFIGKLALTYRLSLENVCKLLEKNTDEATKMAIYELIISSTGSVDLKDAYNFLFNYETLRENARNSGIALLTAGMYLRKYKKAQNENDVEKLKLLEQELNKIDEDFRKLKQKPKFEHFSEEDITIISKYRLKYCISRLQMSKILGVHHKILAENEKKITDARLREKISSLSDFYQDLSASNQRFRKK